MKKIKKMDLGGFNPYTNPWQVVNPNSQETMQQVYAPVQNADITNIEQSQLSIQNNPNYTTRTQNTFGTPNWNYIFGSQMLQGLTNGIANMGANSRQQASLDFNRQKFSPLNYLPSNPNTSLQDLYGQFKKGGNIDPVYVENKNDPRYKAYQDSLYNYDFSQKSIDNAHHKGYNLTPDKSIPGNLTYAQDITNPEHLAYSFPNHRKPIQPVKLGRKSVPMPQNLPLAGMDIGMNNPQLFDIPQFNEQIIRPQGSPVYAPFGENSPLLGYYNNGKYIPSNENSEAAKYNNDSTFINQLMRRNYGSSYQPDEFKKGGFKLNPEHKGDCSPMTKSTCTGKKRTFAENAKNHFKKRKHEDGGYVDDEDMDFLFEDDDIEITPDVVDNIKSKRQMRAEQSANQDAIDEMSLQNSAKFLQSLIGDSNENSNDLNVDYRNIGFNIKPSSGDTLKKGLEYKQYLQSHGMTEPAAAGAVANMYAESSLNAGITNKIGAKGLVQWLGSRRKNLETFAKQNNKSVDDPYLQMDFMMHELNTSEKASGSKLNSISSPEEAALHLMNNYERPSKDEKVQSAGKRVAFARQLSKFEKGGEYNVTKDEINTLKQMGFDFDILD